MLEEYSELPLAEQFERLLTPTASKEEASEALRADLQMAERLKRLDFRGESRVQVRVRAQLAQRMQRAPFDGGSVRSARNGRSLSIANPRMWAGAMLAMLLLLLLVSYVPVMAAIERLLGYGYLPYAGFIPLTDTQVIQGPVTQTEQDWSLTIQQGVRGPENTVIWVGTNLQAADFSAAELILPDGARLPVRSVRQNRGTIRLIFDAFPPQVTQTSLALPSGWQLPVRWISANQAGLPPTQVSTPFGGKTGIPCIDLEQEMQICAQAAYIDAQGTHILLQALRSGQPVPLAWNAESGWQSISLKIPDGRLYRIERFEQNLVQDPSVLSMVFPEVPSGVNVVTLHLPGRVLAPQGSDAWQDGVDLPLLFPDRVPFRSPTPEVVPPSPDRPVAVPTPAASQPPNNTALP